MPRRKLQSYVSGRQPAKGTPWGASLFVPRTSGPDLIAGTRRL
jgi:hypothetical protein